MTDLGSFHAYQACIKGVGWQPVEVPSSSGDETYVVLVNPWGITHENLCHCQGYIYRGHCRHQQIAADSVCRWSELRAPDSQTRQQHKDRICPSCGGPTKYEIEAKG